MLSFVRMDKYEEERDMIGVVRPEKFLRLFCGGVGL